MSAWNRPSETLCHIPGAEPIPRLIMFHYPISCHGYCENWGLCKVDFCQPRNPNKALSVKLYLSSTRKALDQRGSPCYFQALQRYSRNYPTGWQTERNRCSVLITESRPKHIKHIHGEDKHDLKRRLWLLQVYIILAVTHWPWDLAGAGFAGVTACHILPKSFILY